MAGAGVSTQTMRTELDQWAESTLREAAKSVPEDVIAHTAQRAGRDGPEILKELECGSYDLVVLGLRECGRTQEGLLGG